MFLCVAGENLVGEGAGLFEEPPSEVVPPPQEPEPEPPKLIPQRPGIPFFNMVKYP